MESFPKPNGVAYCVFCGTELKQNFLVHIYHVSAYHKLEVASITASDGREPYERAFLFEVPKLAWWPFDKTVAWEISEGISIEKIAFLSRHLPVDLVRICANNKRVEIKINYSCIGVFIADAKFIIYRHGSTYIHEFIPPA